MADYPDWMLKHKKKGTYINRVGDKFYLYAAHSERVPGTNKVRRVSDGYIGRITESEGLIPARDKVQGEVVVFEFGLCMTMLDLCGNVHTGLRREFRAAADWIFVAGILRVAYGDYSPESYHWSFLSVVFPGLDMLKKLTDKQHIGLERCERMIRELLRKRFGDNLSAVMARLSRICPVKVNGQLYSPTLSDELMEWLENLNMDWRDLFGQGRKYDSHVQGDVKRVQDNNARRGRPKKTDS